MKNFLNLSDSYKKSVKKSVFERRNKICALLSKNPSLSKREIVKLLSEEGIIASLVTVNNDLLTLTVARDFVSGKISREEILNPENFYRKIIYKDVLYLVQDNSIDKSGANDDENTVRKKNFTCSDATEIDFLKELTKEQGYEIISLRKKNEDLVAELKDLREDSEFKDLLISELEEKLKGAITNKKLEKKVALSCEKERGGKRDGKEKEYSFPEFSSSNQRIVLSKRFKKEFCELSPEFRNLTVKAVKLLSENPSHPGLETKKFLDRDKEWESRINYKIRFFWRNLKNKIILVRICHKNNL